MCLKDRTYRFTLEIKFEPLQFESNDYHNRREKDLAFRLKDAAKSIQDHYTGKRGDDYHWTLEEVK